MNKSRELQVGVKILLKNKEGKYLLLRRSPAKYPETQKWDIPGGRINVGETLEENLAREVREETGLPIHGPVKLIAAQDILKLEDKHIVRLTYAGRTEGEPVLSDEHEEYLWVTHEELQNVSPLDSYVARLLHSVEIEE